MTHRDKIRIIIVNYCAVEMTERCVGSIVDHGIAPPAQITIVDNCSPDGSFARLQRLHASVDVVAASANRGFGAGLNLGARRSDSDYILALNPDTYFETDTLGPVLEFLDREQDVGIVGLDLVNPDGTRQFSARRFYSLLDVVARRVALLGRILRGHVSGHLMVQSWTAALPFDADWVMGTGMVIRRDVFEALGGMDERYFLYMEDVDLCARTWKAGKRVVGLPTCYLIHAHQRSSARNPFGWQARVHLASLLRFARKFHVGIIRQPGITRVIG